MPILTEMTKFLSLLLVHSKISILFQPTLSGDSLWGRVILIIISS